ncbi:MAG: hypothetical protein ACM3UV_00975 [Nocardioidaceae bacterium]
MSTGDAQQHERRLREAADHLRDADREYARAYTEVENAPRRPDEPRDVSRLEALSAKRKAAQKRVGDLLAESPLSTDEKSKVTGFRPADLARLEHGELD